MYEPAFILVLIRFVKQRCLEPVILGRTPNCKAIAEGNGSTKSIRFKFLTKLSSFGIKPEYISFRALQLIVGSDGMCSGNTYILSFWEKLKKKMSANLIDQIT